MKWRLSRFRAGDVVRVREKEEILATLDPKGTLEGLPFMPEMLRYCGGTFRVRAVAHKTCDKVDGTWRARCLSRTVHLAELACDGSTHDGCDAACSLFWKDDWLSYPNETGGSGRTGARSGGITEAELRGSVKHETDRGELRYSCQATELLGATQPLPWWNLRQYGRDVRTRNRKLGEAARILLLAFLRSCYLNAPRGYRLLQQFRAWVHRLLVHRDPPEFRGAIPLHHPTPTMRLDIQPGELVRIKSKQDIMQTLDERGRNRGMYFDLEMSRYCGGEYRVQARVNRIIDERSGRMVTMKEPCLILAGVSCRSEYSQYRLMCPRAIPSYWREIWVERAELGPGSEG